jgi:hypothetical protein
MRCLTAQKVVSATVIGILAYRRRKVTLIEHSMTTEQDIKTRTDFYNRPDVVKFLCKEGVPRTKKAMGALMVAGGSSAKDSKIDSVSFNCLSFIVFAVHPQQINVRDKSNGMIIASFRR